MENGQQQEHDQQDSDSYVCCWRGGTRTDNDENNNNDNNNTRVVIVAVEGAAMICHATIQDLRSDTTSTCHSRRPIMVAGTLLMDEGNEWDQVRLSGPSMGEKCTYMYTMNAQTSSSSASSSSSSSSLTAPVSKEQEQEGEETEKESIEDFVVCSPLRMSSTTAPRWAQAVLDVTQPDEIVILALGQCAADYTMDMTENSFSDIYAFSKYTGTTAATTHDGDLGSSRHTTMMEQVAPLDVENIMLPHTVNELMAYCSASSSTPQKYTLLYSSYSPAVLLSWASKMYPDAHLLTSVCSHMKSKYKVSSSGNHNGHVNDASERRLNSNSSSRSDGLSMPQNGKLVSSQDALYT